MLKTLVLNLNIIEKYILEEKLSSELVNVEIQ